MSGDAPLLAVAEAANSLSIAVVGCTPAQVARVREAIKARAQLDVIAPSPSWMVGLLSACVSRDIFVVGAPSPATSAQQIVREIIERWPRAAVVVYCEPRREVIPNVGALAAAGAHQFLFFGVNDSGATLRAVLNAARHQCAAEGVMTLFRPLVPTKLHPMIEAALGHPATVTDVRALADAIGVHRRTLFYRCERLRFLNPTEILAWTRLALVGYLLENTGATVESIAMETGYPSPTSLRNTVKRYTGFRATEIRKSGGVRLVIALLARRIEGTRRELHLV
jgi:AraC-like DNA-binding protein